MRMTAAAKKYRTEQNNTKEKPNQHDAIEGNSKNHGVVRCSHNKYVCFCILMFVARCSLWNAKSTSSVCTCVFRFHSLRLLPATSSFSLSLISCQLLWHWWNAAQAMECKFFRFRILCSTRRMNERITTTTTAEKSTTTSQIQQQQ